MLRGASWVTSEESTGLRERVSHMRGSAQSAQSGDVVDAMARRREHAQMMARLNARRRPRPERDAEDAELALSLSSSDEEGGAARGGSQTQAAASAAARTKLGGGGATSRPAASGRKKPKFL